jgi:hypothetical protein
VSCRRGDLALVPARLAARGVSEPEFVRLSRAFFEEIEKRFG